MNRFQTVFTAAIFISFGLNGAAHASTINVTLGNTSSDLSFSAGTPIPSPNLNLAASGSGLVLNNNAQIIMPPTTVLNQYIQPSGSLFGNNYLAVLGRPSTGIATFTLAAGVNEFSFTWGTIDAYNTLILEDSRNISYTITGAAILNRIANSVAGTTQTDVTFYSPFGSIISAQIESSDNAFEGANFSAIDPSPVPLPPTLPLFAAALIGLGLFMRRDRFGKAF